MYCRRILPHNYYKLQNHMINFQTWLQGIPHMCKRFLIKYRELGVQETEILIEIAKLPSGDLRISTLTGRYHTVNSEKLELLEKLHNLTNPQ